MYTKSSACLVHLYLAVDNASYAQNYTSLLYACAFVPCNRQCAQEYTSLLHAWWTCIRQCAQKYHSLLHACAFHTASHKCCTTFENQYTTTAVWEQQSIEVEYLLWKISHENIFRLNIPTIRTLCSKPCQFNEWCHQVKSRSFWQNVLSYTHVHFMLRQKYDQHRTHCTKGLYLNSWCCHLCQ